VLRLPPDAVRHPRDGRVRGRRLGSPGLHHRRGPSQQRPEQGRRVRGDVDPAVRGREPTLELANTAGTVPPGFQLVIDIDGDGTNDGILVGEPTNYGANWWLNNAADAEAKAAEPHTGGGQGSPYYGTLEEWSEALPGANVIAFGFSLGSGILGDWTIESITLGDTEYTFASTKDKLSAFRR
jgi:hypothetical protein